MAFLVNLLLVFIVLKMLDNYFQGIGERERERERVSSSSRERMPYQHCKGFLWRCFCKRDVFKANKKFSKQKMQHFLLVLLLLLHLFVFPLKENECIIHTTQKKEFLFEDLKIQFKWLSLFVVFVIFGFKKDLFLLEKSKCVETIIGYEGYNYLAGYQVGGFAGTCGYQFLEYVPAVLVVIVI